MRKLLFWSHLIAGLLAGLIILLMSATGVVLTYERQLVTWADTRGYRVTSPGAPPLTPEALLTPLAARQPSSLTVYADPQRPALVQFPHDQRLYLDPATGAALGEGAPRVRAFLHSVMELHRWLAASGPLRPWGKAVTGACNLLFLFLIVSGLCLWLPRRRTRAALRAVMVPRWHQNGRARDFNWHNVAGFWMALPLLLVVTSGVVISYGWASNLIYRMTGEEPPARKPRSSQEAPRALAGLDAFWAQAAAKQPGWRSLSVQIPAQDDTHIRFSLDQGNGGQPHLRSTLVLRRPSGDIEEWTPPHSGSPGQRIRAFMRFAHTGEVFGLGGQTVAGLASLVGVLLVYTGYALTWRRYQAWRRRRLNGPFLEPEPEILPWD